MVILVEFYPGGRQYAYNCDEQVNVGDKVVVPAGKNNTEKEVVVTNINPAEEDAKWASKNTIRRA